MVAASVAGPGCVAGKTVVESMSVGTWILWGLAMDLAMVLVAWKIIGLFL